MTLDEKFDCIEMKDEIQAKLRKEWESLTDKEIRDRIRRNLETSQSPIARWWRRNREEGTESFAIRKG